MDRNTITGMLLMLAMLLAYQYFAPAPVEPVKPKVQTQATAPKPKSLSATDSIAQKAELGDFALAGTGIAKDVVLENKNLIVTLNTLGGTIKKVELKNYKTYAEYSAGKPESLTIFDESFDKLTLNLPSVKGKLNVSQLYFTPTGTGNAQKFIVQLASGQSIEQTYTLAENSFELGYGVKLTGLDGAISNESAVLNWEENVRPMEKDLSDNRTKSTVNYRSKNEDIGFAQISEGNSDPKEETISSPLNWVSFKKKYMLSGFIADSSLIKNAFVKSVPNMNDSLNLKTLTAQLSLNTADMKAGKANFKFYFGPNDYNGIKNLSPDFGKNVYLGYAVFQPITKFVFVPLFGFLEKYIGNYGLLIIILVLIIKIALTPLTYKSYISMAKMRVLQPELNELKKKVGDDSAKMQQEQMKLYNQVGVSPLSGCVPVLATMPILMSVFFLFPNLIELRQQHFLWANDLSTFDSVLTLPFKIPMYGSHVSLFALLMTASSLAYGYYNNQMTPDQPGQPIDMKKMAYITPIIFMFVMNSFPAGLSFYYFISNIVTVLQQILIRKFVDEDKIKDILEENRKKIASGTVKKSRFSEMISKSMQAAEEAKRQQDAIKAQQKKGKK